MVTIAHIVEAIVEKRPFLEEALARGIINYASLADGVKADIEKELKKPVKTSAIVMALRRQSDKLKTTIIRAAMVRFRETDITIKSGLFEMTVLKSPKTIGHIREAYDLVDFSRGDFLTITHGLYEITIISSRKHKDPIQKIFEKEKILKTIDNLSSLTIKMPIEAIEAVGPIYMVTKALNWENIPIIEIVSTLTEMTLILKEDDITRAFNALKKIVEGNQTPAEPSAA